MFLKIITVVFFSFQIIFAQNLIKTKNVKITGNINQLSYFFNALKKSNETKVRIAYYGDSIILGDVICNEFRYNFQKKFGGRGLGILPVYSITYGMNKSVEQKFNDKWDYAAIFQRNPNNYNLGINGSVSRQLKGAFVEYEAIRNKYIDKFNDFYLVYSNPSTTATVETVIDNEKNKITLEKSEKIKSIKIAEGGAKKIRLELNDSEGAFLYNVSDEADNGVYVDNLPLTGNSGISLRDLPQEVLREFDKLYNYKLIILQFGANVYTKGAGSFVSYERQMIQAIEHLKKAFPNCSFLLVSTGDKLIKKGSRLATDKDTIKLLRYQKRIAKKTGIAFWNLFEAMGGKNSMIQWVNSKPSLALKDYTHFNDEGGKIIGKLLFNALMNEFEKNK